MEYNFAMLNENKICICVATYFQPLKNPPENLVGIEKGLDVQWRKYENNQWSIEKFEPVSTAPLTEFEQLKTENESLKQNLQSVNADLQSFMDFYFTSTQV